MLIAFRQKAPVPEEPHDDKAESDLEETPFERIRCPLCLWQPDAFAMWCCTDCPHPEGFHGGCGMMWNTFTTRGRCPSCSHQWRWTACLHCEGWALHQDWYVKSGKEAC